MDVVSIKPETPLVDVMDGDARREVRLGEHGLVALVDVMPRLVPQGKGGDWAIAQAARVSYGAGTKSTSDDRTLIRHLMRHRHTSPVEMCEVKMHHVLPVFVARQLVRHRTANLNEYSARYSVVKDRFYRPSVDQVRAQSSVNKQGSQGTVDELTAEEFVKWLQQVERQHYIYEAFIERGVSRELARIGLPLSMYTEWYWKIDLHNLLHFLSLRMDEHAQQEIRDYANAIFLLIQPLFPDTVEAFVDYRLGAITLSRLEVEAIRGVGYSQWDAPGPLNTSNKREQAEWEAKKRKLNLA